LKTWLVVPLGIDPGIAENVFSVWFCVRTALWLWGPGPRAERAATI